MRRIPEDEKKLREFAQDTIDQCRASAPRRIAAATAMRQWLYAGSGDGVPAIYNKLYQHIERLTTWLYSPDDLRFVVEFDDYQPKDVLDKGKIAARELTKTFRKREIDINFIDSVNIALTHGTCIPKTLWTSRGPVLRNVPPWLFGVYDETKDSLEDQEAVCETTYISTHELWRRISHLPNADRLYRRAVLSARRDGEQNAVDSLARRVIVAGNQPIVDAPVGENQIAGFVRPTSTAPDSTPEIAIDLIPFHELWVVDDVREDYTTIHMIEPDIVISPRPEGLRRNLFIDDSRMLPYRQVKLNRVPGMFWGRSELVDLLKLQAFLRDRIDDIKKIMSLQYDRIWAFKGFEGDPAELHTRLKRSGYVNLPGPTASIEDLTPKLPENAFQEIGFILEFMDEVSGFQKSMLGAGETGVRAGVHAQTLTKNSSPRMKTRALITERAVGNVGESTMKLQAAKGIRAHWTSADDKESDFLLSQLPKDARPVVQSHSCSPVYQDDHIDMIAFLAKLEAIDGEDALELLPMTNKDTLLANLRARNEAKQQMIRENPEMAAKLLGKRKS